MPAKKGRKKTEPLKMGMLLMSQRIFRGMEEATFNTEIAKCIMRHANGDWGDLEEEDKEMNKTALEEGDQVFSSYKTSKGNVWIITEGDRESTTVIFSDEY